MPLFRQRHADDLQGEPQGAKHEQDSVLQPASKPYPANKYDQEKGAVREQTA
jgi:hypothetical protein